MDWLRRYWHILVLALTPLLALWRAIFLGQAIGPFDQIRQMSPWNGPKSAQPWDVLQADGVLQFYPWRDLVFESWGKFQVPFWNHYELAGYPLIANSQSAVFYPPHILMGILHVPTATAMALLAWFHLALAGFGTSFLARQLGAGRLGGVLAGVSFTLSAFMVSWTGLPSVITTVAWIPWVLGLVIRVVAELPFSFSSSQVVKVLEHESDEDARAALDRIANERMRRFLRTAVALTLCMSMMILGGHLQFIAYGFMAAVIVGLWHIFGDDAREGVARITARLNPGAPKVGRRMQWVLIVLAIVGIHGTASLIVAPQLRPVLEYSKFSHRRNSPTEENYLGYQNSAIQPYELVGIMHPNLVGSPSEPVKQIESPQPLSSYWPGYIKRGANFAEGAIGLGPLVIGLLLLARRRFDIRRWGGVALVGALAFLLATGTALGRILYFVVPGWSSTGSPGRISVLFVLAMCVLAGIAATQDKEEEPKEKWRMYVPIGGLAVIAIISIYALMFALGDLQPLQPISSDIFATILASATGGPKAMAAISTLIAAGAIGFWLHQQRKHGWVLLLAAFACFFLSVPQVLRFSESADLNFDPPGAKYERYAFQNNPWDLWFAAPALAPPNIAMLNRVHELGGYDSLVHGDTVDMLKQVDGEDPAALANGNMMFVKPKASKEALAEAGVRYYAQRMPDGNVNFEQLLGKGRAYTPAEEAEILDENPGQIKLRATGPGKLVLKDRNMPGWTVTVDGQPTSITGETWREVELPEGQHEVVMNYSPPNYLVSLIGSILAWLVLGVVALRSWRK